MPDVEKPNQDNQQDRLIQQELRLARKFSLADVIGQEAGDFMKGESPVPRLVQVKTEMATLLKENLKDSPGALQVVLQRWLTDNDSLISRHLNAPIGALTEALETVLQSPGTFYELVRQVDAQWGAMYGERPHFQHPGQEAHPDDEYTHESVHQTLMTCLNRLLALQSEG